MKSQLATKPSIPPYPAVAAKLEHMAREGGGSLQELSKVVAADPALATAVIGRAHSAALGGRPVSTLFEALTRVGMTQLIELALAVSLGEAATAAGPLSELRRDHWRCALLSAHLARMLAGARGVSSEAAYIAGLLHDIGATVVVGAIEELGKKTQLPTLTQTEWTAVVRRYQLQAGMIVATRWHLPESLVDVIARRQDTPIVRLIALTDQIIALLDDMPTVGLAALIDIPELSENERVSIGSAVQEVVKSMASYATPKKSTPSNVVHETSAGTERAFPVSFEVTQPPHEQSRAQSISPNALQLAASVQLSPNWLVELTLHCSPAPITMLANVRSCDRVGNCYQITAQPFALGGATKDQWIRLLAEARASATP